MCAGAYCESCAATGVLNSTFEDNAGIGLCLHDVNGYLNADGLSSDAEAFPPLFGPVTKNDHMINVFLGYQVYVWVDIIAEVRDSFFRRNTASLPSEFEHNSATVQAPSSLGEGGAIDMRQVAYTILSGNTFEGNAGRQGAAVRLDSCASTVIWNSTFHNNLATHEGGAVASVDSYGTGVLLGECSITNCSGFSGGAVYADEGATIVITNSSHLINNSASSAGGAVHCVGCANLTMQLGSIASLNHAQQSGGAFACDNCNVFHLDQAVLSNNRYFAHVHESMRKPQQTQVLNGMCVSGYSCDYDLGRPAHVCTLPTEHSMFYCTSHPAVETLHPAHTPVPMPCVNTIIVTAVQHQGAEFS